MVLELPKVITYATVQVLGLGRITISMDTGGGMLEQISRTEQSIPWSAQAWILHSSGPLEE
jgi:hypothetical protein